ncbi:TetR/AcrR family transcriptional regulator [Streptomyces sp. 71268]|uniref:TetR/AcrR family transcriptional regulator n=1 Tax=Streptomyces sp. 71268 TaxID=3002640 RepID=UPI0023F68B54|nr:TetR/AcrR family transcriptional regulator [Streptomyces sp. 71268]WEV24052.1 TetR/AcrR family transcriptional regulator [Streptomyces sp. 71268]
MAGKRDWLEAGLAVLAADGAGAVTIDRLCGDLGLTKGSFYHHFKGITGFRTELLAHFEAESTTRFIEAVEDVPGPTGAKFTHLLDLALADEGDRPGLEVAVRAWALGDVEARAAQRRIDERRIAYLHDLLCESAAPDAAADARPTPSPALGTASQAITPGAAAVASETGGVHTGADGKSRDWLPLARLLYLVLVGGGHLVPPLPAEELRDIYRLASRLAPGGPWEEA